MQALRQYYTVQGNTVVVRLPEDFSATEIEVIILPREERENFPSVAQEPSLEIPSPWQQRRSSPPPPLPVWTEEERRNFLTVLQNGPTLSEEEISEWEKDIEQARSWKPQDWSEE